MAVDFELVKTLGLQLEQYVQTLGFPDTDTSTYQLFYTALAAKITPDDALKWAKEFFDTLKAEGRTPYDENTGAHEAGQTLINYVLGRAAGLTFGTAATETLDDRAKQIHALLAQKAGAESDIAAGRLKREDTNLDRINAMLVALVKKPLGHA
jgi:hypothetical protein